MVTSVDLHGQPFGATQEVSEIRANGKLPDKPVTAESSRFPVQPQQRLRLIAGLAK